MLTMFKNHSKNIMIGGALGATLGAAAGAAAGQAGINQSCIDGFSDSLCDHIHQRADSSAVRIGALTGAAVGFGVGAIAYPIYKAFCGWAYGQNPTHHQLQDRRESIALEVVGPNQEELVANRNLMTSAWGIK